eukprot:bmy_02051T0
MREKRNSRNKVVPNLTCHKPKLPLDFPDKEGLPAILQDLVYQEESCELDPTEAFFPRSSQKPIGIRDLINEALCRERMGLQSKGMLLSSTSVTSMCDPEHVLLLPPRLTKRGDSSTEDPPSRRQHRAFPLCFRLVSSPSFPPSYRKYIWETYLCGLESLNGFALVRGHLMPCPLGLSGGGMKQKSSELGWIWKGPLWLQSWKPKGGYQSDFAPLLVWKLTPDLQSDTW